MYQISNNNINKNIICFGLITVFFYFTKLILIFMLNIYVFKETKVFDSIFLFYNIIIMISHFLNLFQLI